MGSGRGGGRERTWEEELACLVEDTGIRYVAEEDTMDGVETHESDQRGLGFDFGDFEEGVGREESFRDQVKGFLTATGELMQELGRSCWDIVEQSMEGVEDSLVVQKLREPVSVAKKRLEFLNEYLPEDRDPRHAWPIVIFVFLLAFSALSVNTDRTTIVEVEPPKKISMHPPTAARIQLPDGRNLSYQERGATAERARFSMISPHSFLSSRLAGIPGIKESLLEEFGVRLISYDLPGFGESDPHYSRNLNSSALDMLHLANALGVVDKFWVVGHSGGGIHAWAAVRYIPTRLAGAVMLAPTGNPYDTSMTKEEKSKIWEKWTARRKFMYILARRFPSALHYIYSRSFLSGKHDQPEKWLLMSLDKKDKALMDEQVFKDFWERDVEESVRQGDTRPFIEEAVLQVSDWGFTLADVQIQRKRDVKGLLSFLKSLYGRVEREWAGFLGPIHIWQGMDDTVTPPSMTEFVRRVVPGATVHQLLGEGHFSYFWFCDECHRHIFSTLFGTPNGPLEPLPQALDDEIQTENEYTEEVCHNCTDHE